MCLPACLLPSYIRSHCTRAYSYAYPRFRLWMKCEGIVCVATNTRSVLDG
nr:MAG TPA: hypothetical protein [Caudoviricetes sp.]